MGVSEDKHTCGLSRDYWQCIDGRVYGPCADENCGGVCEIESDCRCECHQETAVNEFDTAPEQQLAATVAYCDEQIRRTETTMTGISGTNWGDADLHTRPADLDAQPTAEAEAQLQLHRRLGALVDDAVVKIFTENATPAVPPPPTGPEIIRTITRYSEWLRDQPQPPIRVEVGPGVVDALQATAQPRTPAAGLLPAILNVPVVEVFALNHGAWQLIGADGRVTQGRPLKPAERRA